MFPRDCPACEETGARPPGPPGPDQNILGSLRAACLCSGQFRQNNLAHLVLPSDQTGTLSKQD